MDFRSDQKTFLAAVLDSLDLHIAVIDECGAIIYVNQAWIAFSKENGLGEVDWLQSNYLDACNSASIHSDLTATEIAAAMRSVINNEVTRCSYEYPCHSPTEERWFMMEMTLLSGFSPRLFVISHLNITQRRLAEEAVELLSLQDPLTGLSNRRHFDQFLNAEWHRNERDKTPISLILFDIDYFKAFNDKFGHIAGDKCLSTVASLIRDTARRATDLAVRWGGEEFILLLGNTPLEDAVNIAEEVRLLVQSTQIAEFGQCTISAGVISIVPNDNNSDVLVRLADEALYRAKEGGRNIVITAEPPIIKSA